MGGDGHHIASRCRSGERHCRPELGHVVEGCTSQGQDSIESHTRRRANALGLPDQGDEVVRGDAGGSVVRGTVLVVNDHGPPSEEVRERGGDPIAGNGKRHTAAKANPTYFGRGKRHERVQ